MIFLHRWKLLLNVNLTKWHTLQTAQTWTKAFWAAFFWSLALCPCCFLIFAAFSADFCWDWTFCCPLAIFYVNTAGSKNYKYIHLEINMSGEILLLVIIGFFIQLLWKLGHRPNVFNWTISSNLVEIFVQGKLVIIAQYVPWK